MTQQGSGCSVPDPQDPKQAPACGLEAAPHQEPMAPLPELPSREWPWWRRLLVQVFALDLRSLAAFRIVFALVLLLDLSQRWLDLEAHYTDFGVLPRSALFEQFLQPMQWTIHAATGTVAGMAVLFSLQALAALALLFGYRTRLATILCWIFWVSLCARNGMVQQGGDLLLKCALFWAIFCPLGARWSVDSALHGADRSRAGPWLGIGGVALIMQLVLLYWCTVLLKWHITWGTGEALGMALELDVYAYPLGTWLKQFPAITVPLTWFAITCEIAGPALVLLPFWRGLNRSMAFLLMFSFHFGIALCMAVGLFSAIAIAVWVAVLPAAWWTFWDRRLRPKVVAPLMVYDVDCFFCKRSIMLLRGFLGLPRDRVVSSDEAGELAEIMHREESWVVQDAEGQIHLRYDAVLQVFKASPIGRFLHPIMALAPMRFMGDKGYRWVSANRHAVAPLVRWMRPANPFAPRGWLFVPMQWFCGAILFLVIAWNVRTIDWDDPGYFKEELGITEKLEWNWLTKCEPLIFALGLEQKWNMFSPHPSVEDGWYVITAKTVDDRRLDIYNGGGFIDCEPGPVDWSKPDDVSAAYLRQRWRKYLNNMWARSNQRHRVWFGRWLTRSYNRVHKGDDRIKQFHIWYVEERTNFDGTTQPVKRHQLHHHMCF